MSLYRIGLMVVSVLPLAGSTVACAGDVKTVARLPLKKQIPDEKLPVAVLRERRVQYIDALRGRMSPMPLNVRVAERARAVGGQKMAPGFGLAAALFDVRDLAPTDDMKWVSDIAKLGVERFIRLVQGRKSKFSLSKGDLLSILLDFHKEVSDVVEDYFETLRLVSHPGGIIECNSACGAERLRGDLDDLADIQERIKSQRKKAWWAYNRVAFDVLSLWAERVSEVILDVHFALLLYHGYGRD